MESYEKTADVTKVIELLLKNFEEKEMVSLLYYFYFLIYILNS